ncbi:MAG TPA: hypothetical protein VHC96_17940, partial [Puia sp.]|nr:hypothetical protein [Puia sp.]
SERTDVDQPARSLTVKNIFQNGPMVRGQPLHKFLSNLFKNSADRNMTEGHYNPTQFAETHARCGKKNFLDVDILLKSWLIFATC